MHLFPQNLVKLHNIFFAINPKDVRLIPPDCFGLNYAVGHHIESTFSVLIGTDSGVMLLSKNNMEA